MKVRIHILRRAACTAVLCLWAPGFCPAEAGAGAGGAASGNQADSLAAFSRASVEWGNGVEGVLEEAFRKCFRTYIVDGKVLTVRMPFGENNERSELADSAIEVRGGGKADPDAQWTEIDTLLDSAGFREYVAALSDGREKIVHFDLSAPAWSVAREWFPIEQMKSGIYVGLPHKPAVLSTGRGATASDVYNYVYCIGRLGMDCSGFVWFALKTLASRVGIDLDQEAGRYVGASSAVASWYVGTWFFDPRNVLWTEVKDQVRNLRPGDVILFRGEDGATVHSAVIQSIDRSTGTVRYLQSTDEAPQAERGVHESFLHFDPARPEASLRDPSVIWHQRLFPPFTGEKGVPYRDDGERYRAHPDLGGGTVVRLKALERAAESLSAAGH
jgi:hypothetical protein